MEVERSVSIHLAKGVWEVRLKCKCCRCRSLTFCFLLKNYSKIGGLDDDRAI